MLLKQICYLVLFSSSLISYQVHALVQDPVQELLEQAKSWESLDRIDLARVALNKLFIIETNNPDALKHLIFLDMRQSKKLDALKHFTRLQNTSPNYRYIKHIKRLMQLNGSQNTQLQQARLLAKSGRSSEAASAFKALFPEGMPTSQIAFEYWQVVAKTPNGWKKAKKGLQQLTINYPKNLHYSLAYIEHRLARDPSNKQLLNKLKPFIADKRFQRQAAATWRRAVYRLDATPPFISYFEDYLTFDAKDEAISEQLKQAKRTLKRRKNLLKNHAYRAKLRGVAALKQRDYDRAQKEFLYTLKFRFNDKDAIEGMADILFEKGEYAAARKYYRRMWYLVPELRSKWNALVDACDVWGGVRDAKLLMAKQRNSEAKQILLTVLSIDKQPYVMTLLAELSNTMGDEQSAQQWYRKSLRIAPNNSSALKGLITLYSQQGDLRRATAMLNRLSHQQRKTLGEDYTSLRVSLLKAQAEKKIKQGSNKRALAYLEKARPLSPNDAWLLYDIAKLYRDLKQAKKAIPYFDAALAKQPRNKQLIYAYTLYLASIGADLEALSIIERAPKPLDTDLQTTQKRLWMSTGQQQVRALAKQSHQQAVNRMSVLDLQLGEDANYLQRIASLWVELGEDERGLNVLLRSNSNETQVALQQLQDQIQLKKAQSLAQQKQFRPALTALSNLTQTGQKQTPVIRLKASLLRALEQPQEAINTYKKLQKLEPTEQWIAPILVRLHLQQGQFEQAKTEINTHIATLGEPNKQARINWYNEAIATGLSRQAQDTLERLKHDYPNDSDVWSLTFNALSDTQSDDERLAQLKLLTGQDKQFESPLSQQIQTALDDLSQLRSPRLSMDFQVKNYTSSAAKSSLNAVYIPIEYRMPSRQNGFLFMRFDYVSLNAGSLPITDKQEVSEFGQGLFCFPNCTLTAQNESVSGNYLAIGYDNKTMRMDIGLMPQQFLVNDWVGGVKWSGDIDVFYWGIDVSRRPLSSSKLSYAGNRDINTGEVWGGVKQTGMTLSFGFDEGGDIGFWSNFDWHLLSGKNVANNQRQRLLGGVYWRIKDDDDFQVSIGLNAQFWRFEHSLDEYTFGHGGYYSPNQYRSLAIPLDIIGRFSPAVSYRLKTSISYSVTNDDRIGFFPNNASLQTQAEALQNITGIDPYFSGGSGGGSGITLLAGLEYKMNQKLSLGIEYSTVRSDSYQPQGVLAYFRYLFDGRQRKVRMPPKPLGLYANF